MNNYEINSDFQEIKKHGTSSFPFMIYNGKMPDYQSSYPLHWHEEMEIIFVVSGIGAATVNYTSYNLKEGDILLIRPHDIHSNSQYKDYTYEYFNILFRFSILEDKLPNLSYNKHFLPLIEHTKKLPTYIEKKHPLAKLLTPYLINLINNRHNISKYELMIKSDLFAIMYHIEKYETEDKNNIQNAESDNKLKEILTYINDNYSSSITIDDISKSCHYSKSYFMKFFKKQTGYSFIQYLNDYRLEIASKYLIETDKKVSDIAVLVGFDNIPYFVRCFHKKYNMSPKEYRKKRGRA